MADEQGSEDRTEAPTARRLQRAREAGQVPLSRDATTVAVLGAGALALAVAAPPAARAITVSLAAMLARPDPADPGATLREAGLDILTGAAPFALAVIVAACAAVLLQTRFLLNADALRPDLARLDPRRGLRRILGMDALLDAGKSTIVIPAAGWVGWTVLAGARGDVFGAVLWTPSTLLSRSAHHAQRILLVMLAVQTVIGGLDLARVRLRHVRSLRMSRQDLRDEHRESEGDPHVKGRQKRLRRQVARRRMLAAVPRATVVLTNPTHYAVALAYARGQDGAPRVVAKGIDEMAMRIREAALDARVPLVANPPLARALYPIDLDREIPSEHFKAVAEIIAYVWRLRTPRRGPSA